MLDLSLLRDSRSFSTDASSSARLALLHTSMRIGSRRPPIEAYQFYTHFPGLGLLNLAHSLRIAQDQGRLKCRLEVRYFDEESYEEDETFVAAIDTWLQGADRAILGASTYTSTIEYLEKLFTRFDPGRVLIVAGGPHATVAPDINGAHVVVRGEGGSALLHILNTVLTDDFGAGPEAAGICYQLNGKKRIEKQAFDRSLETLPSPGFAYDLLPDSPTAAPVYLTTPKRMLGERPQIYICTQSCRARCTFCSTYLIHGRSVARPIDKVRADLTYLVRDRGYDSIEFHDDDLLQHPDFQELMHIMKELDVPWFCYARVPPITEEVAQLMGASGCGRVFLGVESLEQRTLDYLNKATTVEQNVRAVRALAGAGVGVVAAHMFGMPHDTVEAMLRNIDSYLVLPVLFANNSILSPDPGTTEFHRARQRSGLFRKAFGGESGMRLVPNPEEYGVEIPYGLPSVCHHVSKSDLNRLLFLAEVEFYLRDSQWSLYESTISGRPMVGVAAYYQYLHSQVESFEAYMREGDPLIALRWGGFLAGLEKTALRRRWRSQVRQQLMAGD